MTRRPLRLRRSVLYVPASNEKAVAKSETLACDAVIYDLEDAVAVADLIPGLAGKVPPFGLLVNNASLFEGDRLESLTAERMDRHHAVNLRAPVLLSQAYARQVRMQATDGAAPRSDCCIVNLLDNKVFAPNPDYLSYSLTKFALEGLTRMLAMELAPEIRVAGIAPGVTLPSGPQTEEEFARSQASLMLGRGCTPEQILASPYYLLGSVDGIAERLHELRERFGVSYFSVLTEGREAFAPVVSRLAGA